MDQQELNHLQREMESLRADLLAGRLEEERVWQVMQQASELLEQARGSRMEETVTHIFTLISAVWSNTRNQARLRDIKRRVS